VTTTTTTGKPRRGRPFKAPKKGKRAPLSLLVRAEVKQLVDERAKASGRTQSQEAEAMIERCLTYDQTMAAIGTTLAEMEKGNVESFLWRRGFTPIRPSGKDGLPLAKEGGGYWTVWAEPGYPGIERPGFIP
jgi:hypothetical protein